MRIPLPFIQALLSLTLLSTSGIFAALAAPNQVTSGIKLHSTRVIYPGGEKGGVTYTLTNNTDNLYLLQTRITPFGEDAPEGNVTQPIVALPPLQRFEAGERRTLRVRAVDTQQLPSDRESVFTLALKAIPSQQTDSADEDNSSDNASANGANSGVTLQFAVQNNLKVFYRPDGLPALTAQEVSQQLNLRRQGNTLVVTNPTPYYVTFSELFVGATALAETDINQMVPPLGEQAYPLPETARGEVRWRTLNDYGVSTEEEQRVLK